MSSFGYLIKEGFKNLVHNRLMTLASIGVLISCLVLTGSAVMLTINVSNIVDSVGDTNVTKVFLDDSYTKLEAVYKGKELSQVANVSQVEFIDKDEAIQAYRDQLGDEVFANMSGDDNPLPYAYSVKMDDLSKYDDTVARIKEVEGVDKPQPFISIDHARQYFYISCIFAAYFSHYCSSSASSSSCSMP